MRNSNYMSEGLGVWPDAANRQSADRVSEGHDDPIHPRIPHDGTIAGDAAQALADVYRWREVAASRGETQLPSQIAARQAALRRDLLAA